VYNLHHLVIGDIITAINGVDRDEFTQNLDVYIKLNVESGTKFNATVLRNGEKTEMSVETYREHFRKIEQ
jgi:C-terminal processing protease CtpA/Prc